MFSSLRITGSPKGWPSLSSCISTVVGRMPWLLSSSSHAFVTVRSITFWFVMVNERVDVPSPFGVSLFASLIWR